MKKLIILIIICLIPLTGCVIEIDDDLGVKINDKNFNVNIDGLNKVEIGDTRTIEEEFEVKGQKELEVRLDVSGADLSISKTEDNLFKGIIETNIKNLKPKIELKDNRIIIDDNFKYNGLGKYENNWNLKFTNNIPLKLDIDSNASDNGFDFTGMKISKLDIDTNAASTDINFNEKNEEDLDKIKLDINAGDLDIFDIGNANASDINVDVNAGSVDIDFGDKVFKDTEVSIEANASSITIDVPEDVGISIEKENMLSSLSYNSSEFDKVNGRYISKNYDKAKYKIEIELEGGVSSFDIK
ncbi:LiaF domain-containing protein [Dethiothermospora halolimnae]|uniref:LiaF domain-containing protein n=1 Tax=Dethiothermospora halolimnae TaxID=3114390 RepID=UPI003CCBA44D